MREGRRTGGTVLSLTTRKLDSAGCICIYLPARRPAGCFIICSILDSLNTRLAVVRKLAVGEGRDFPGAQTFAAVGPFGIRWDLDAGPHHALSGWSPHRPAGNTIRPSHRLEAGYRGVDSVQASRGPQQPGSWDPLEGNVVG